jgi:3'-5' exonuclease
MSNHVIVWDLETVPDLRGFAAASGHDGKSDDEVHEAMGDKFPKHIFRSIICIGALVARRDNAHWEVTALGAPHIGEISLILFWGSTWSDKMSNQKRIGLEGTIKA